MAEGSEIRFDPRSGRLMIFEPGKQSARYAHELFFENERRSDFPYSIPTPPARNRPGLVPPTETALR